MDRRPPAIMLMGPTASGKTEMAIELASRFPCRIISVDSAMIYREMDIGTAKPEAELLARAPHHLIDILDPSESYSAARFRSDALVEIEKAHKQGEVPLLVGGTLLYFKALEQGLSPLPEADPALREAIAEEAKAMGWEALHRQLAEVDPESAARIHPNDPQRLSRAIEVYRLTGESLSRLWRRGEQQALPFRLLKLAIAPADREWLRERIALRFNQMLEQGFVAEVERLMDRSDLHGELPSMRAVGYRQIWSYLQGEYEYEQMRERGIIATRQYAKRQFTWLRKEEQLHWLESRDARRLDQTLKILTDAAIHQARGSVLD